MSQTVELFNQALALQNEKKYEEALSIYKKILDEGHSDLNREQASTISYNMALCYFQKNDSALASVFAQKALYLNPRNAAADTFRDKNPVLFQTKAIARDIPWTESVDAMGLRYLPLELLFLLIFALIFFLAKKLFSFALRRKQALIANVKPPRWPWSIPILCAAVLLFSSLFALKWFHLHQPQAIVKATTTSVQTQAGADQAVITQAELGHILNILQVVKDSSGAEYVQIKYPGSYSGWVKKADLELLNALEWMPAK